MALKSACTFCTRASSALLSTVGATTLIRSPIITRTTKISIRENPSLLRIALPHHGVEIKNWKQYGHNDQENQATHNHHHQGLEESHDGCQRHLELPLLIDCRSRQHHLKLT